MATERISSTVQQLHSAPAGVGEVGVGGSSPTWDCGLAPAGIGTSWRRPPALPLLSSLFSIVALLHA